MISNPNDPVPQAKKVFPGTPRAGGSLKERSASFLARDAEWRLLGFGHCHLSQIRATLRTFSLKRCLMRCTALGLANCRFASFVDTNILHQDGLAGGACYISRRCSMLHAVTPGAVTYYRSSNPNFLQTRWRRVHDGLDHRFGSSDLALATLALASPFSTPGVWQRQACIAKDSTRVYLRLGCESPDLGVFLLRQVSRKADSVMLRIETKTRMVLCADGGKIRFAQNCRQGLWHVRGDWQNLRGPMEGRRYQTPIDFVNEGEACVWLRLDGSTEYLAVFQDELVLSSWQAWNASQPSLRWVFGFKQPRHKETLRWRVNGDRRIGAPALPQADIWLMASDNYITVLNRVLASLEVAGDPVEVHICWVQNLRNLQSRRGWEGDTTRSTSQRPHYHFFLFSYLRLQLIFEAQLFSTLRRKPLPIVIMDLDVQVYPGWIQSLSACVDTERQADICLTQSPGLGIDRFQITNAGLMAFRGGSVPAAIYAHVFLARLHSLEFIQHVFPEKIHFEHDQLTMNVLLHRVAHEGLRGCVRWGIYNPLVAYTGLHGPYCPLSVRFHHATASAASLSLKLKLLDEEADLVMQLRASCAFHPTLGKDGSPIHVLMGPLSPICLYMTMSDPHFGPHPELFRMYQGFGAEVADEGNERPIAKWMMKDRVIRDYVWEDPMFISMQDFVVFNSWLPDNETETGAMPTA